MPDHDLSPPPPQYTPPLYPETRPSSQIDTKNGDQSFFGPIQRRVSILVESSAASETPFSSSSNLSTNSRGDEKSALRTLLTKFGSRQNEQLGDDAPRTIEDICSAFNLAQFGTKVSIEASYPINPHIQRHQIIRGLEQAASVKRWVGGGKPAEAWGKLMKDPELWDVAGDTLVFFGYQRPEASFRVKSSILQETNSDILHSKLQEGYQRAAKTAPPTSKVSKINFGIGGRAKPSEHVDPSTETQIRHEIYFPSPPDQEIQEILRHHVTTRNFLALLMDRPIVGLSFYQALADLHERLLLYMPQAKDTSCAQMIIRYLVRNQLHNVCEDPVAAAGLLAWSEDIRWQEGWREGFVHCCGMYVQLRHMSELRDISKASRGLIERAHLELQARTQEAEETLARFELPDIWPAHTTQPPFVRTDFDHFRKFLLQFYEKAFKSWPPRERSQSYGGWLTKNIVQRIQKDFAALYAYMVDRDIVWEKAEQRGEADRAVFQHNCESNARATADDLQLANLLAAFDYKHKYSHVPFPLPKLPKSIPHQDILPKKPSLFGNKNKASEKHITQVYEEANNANFVGSDITTNRLVEAFLNFEKNSHLGAADPRNARKERWILLYGLVQVLESVSAESPNLWFGEDAPYFLNPRMKGTPPWKTRSDKT